MVDGRNAPENGEPRPLLGVATAFGTGAGVALVIRIAVTNAAAARRVLTVSALGVDPTWLDGPARTAALEPGESALVELQVTPPKGTVPANYPMVVAVQALDPDRGDAPTSSPALAETTVTVNPRTQLAIELKPRTMTLIAARRFTVQLHNSGAVAAQVKLHLRPSSQTIVHLARDEVRVGPGEVVSVRGRARVRRPQWFGTRLNHPFTVTARGTESVRHVDGVFAQRAVIGPGLAKFLILGLVIAVWAGAAIVAIPVLSSKIRTTAEEAAAADSPAAQQSTDDAGEEGAGGAEGGEDGGSEGAGGEGDAAGGDEDEGLQLSGTVAGDSPGDVTVKLETTSLVDEEAQGGVGVGVPSSELDSTGMRLASAFVPASNRAATPARTVQTSADGSWAFPAVRAPGYYLVTFSKPGFQIQRFVVDSSSEAAAEPLEIDLEPGEGSLSGKVTGPGGPVGGASITITDGVNTTTTSSASQGDVGAWSIQGLSTPSSYVVTASRHGMSSESVVVPLAAGGEGTAPLRLVSGVTNLSGTVVRPDGKDDTKPVGGLTVSVSDAAGQVRTATTLTAKPRGHYTIPGLPAPGTYSITVAGAGYQARTMELELKAGQALAEQNFLLRPSTGELGGQILTADTTASAKRGPRSTAGRTGLPNAGLTLANAEHTYKTTSTGADGAYEITGIAPGTYVLTTQYFGKITDHVNVEIAPGEPLTLNRTLVEQAGAGLPATSRIRGSVINAATGLPVGCPSSTSPSASPSASPTPSAGSDTVERCLSATVTDRAVSKDGVEVGEATYAVDFAPDEQYQLPDPESGSTTGLRPGLQQVHLTAPGFEAGIVKVEVRQGTAVEAPLAELFPAPIVSGTVTAAVPDPTEGNFPTSCVWVLKGTKGTADVRDLNCATQLLPGGECLKTTNPYDGTSASAERWCASTSNGTYSVQVPAAGNYTVYVQARSVEYAAANPVPVVLGRAAVHDHSPILDRYGRVELTVKAPDGADLLVPTDGIQVEVRPGTVAPLVSAIPLTGEGDLDTGTTVVSGLRDGQRYSFTAEYDVLAAGAPEGSDPIATLTGSVYDVSVPLNQIGSATLRLTDPVPYLMGRVGSTYDGLDQAVQGATVAISGTAGYDGETVDPGTSVNVTTDSVGCFVARSTTLPARTGRCGTGDASSWPRTAWEQRSLATNRATVSVAAPGYTTDTFTGPFTTFGVTDYKLTPAPVAFDVRAAVAPDVTLPADEWQDVLDHAIVTVQPTGRSNTGLAAKLRARAGDPDAVDLDWSDSTITAAEAGAIADPVRPGTYTVSVQLDGYELSTGTLRCTIDTAAAGDGRCDWLPDQALRLEKVGSIRVTVVDTAGTPVVGARVQKLGPRGQEDTTIAGGIASFTGLQPVTLSDAHQFTVTARTFTEGTSRANWAPSDAVLLTCTGTGHRVTIPAGGEADCTLTLNRPYAVVTGTLQGALYPESATDPEVLTDFEHLAGRRVTLTQCDNVTCTDLDDDVSWTQTTSLAVTGPGGTVSDPGGRYTFAATDEVDGVKPGRYLLSVHDDDLPEGFVRPSTAGGTIIVVPEIKPEDPDAPADVRRTVFNTVLFPEPIDFTLQVLDQHQKPVTDATLVLTRDDLPGQTEEPSSVDAASGRYFFTSQWPGDWTVTASADGISEASTDLPLQSRSIDGGSVKTIWLTRDGAAVSGLVQAQGTSVEPLSGATVTLTCAASNRPRARYCPPGGGPATGTDGRPLVMQTVASYVREDTAKTEHKVNFTFESVATGSYDVKITKHGYLTPPTTTVQVGEAEIFNLGATLSGVSRTVSVRVRTSHLTPGANFAAQSTLTLVATGDTPALPTTEPHLNYSGTPGLYTASFTNLRWGCYRLTLDLPPGHEGTIDGPSGASTDPGFGCPAGTNLIVPDDSQSGINVDFAVEEGLLTYQVPADTWEGHEVPAGTTVEMKRGSWSRTVELVGDGGLLWVPPGDYTVRVVVPEADEDFWRVDPAATVTVPRTGGVTATVGLEELTFDVLVSVPSLTGTEVAQILVTQGAGQEGEPPTGTSTGSSYTVTIPLPRGRWDIQGSWPGGTDFDTIDVQGPGVPDVILGPAAPPTTP